MGNLDLRSSLGVDEKCLGPIPLVSLIDPEHCRGCWNVVDGWGLPLGYGKGWEWGYKWAGTHPAGYELPVGTWRGDLFAFGFFDGVLARWCVVEEHHEKDNRCLGRWPCQLLIAEAVREKVR